MSNRYLEKIAFIKNLPKIRTPRSLVRVLDDNFGSIASSSSIEGRSSKKDSSSAKISPIEVSGQILEI